MYFVTSLFFHSRLHGALGPYLFKVISNQDNLLPLVDEKYKLANMKNERQGKDNKIRIKVCKNTSK